MYNGIIGMAELACVTTAFNEVTRALPFKSAVATLIAVAARSKSSLAFPMVALP